MTSVRSANTTISRRRTGCSWWNTIAASGQRKQGFERVAAQRFLRQAPLLGRYRDGRARVELDVEGGESFEKERDRLLAVRLGLQGTSA